MSIQNIELEKNLAFVGQFALMQLLFAQLETKESSTKRVSSASTIQHAIWIMKQMKSCGVGLDLDLSCLRVLSLQNRRSLSTRLAFHRAVAQGTVCISLFHPVELPSEMLP
jgi:hypothetical protein